MEQQLFRSYFEDSPLRGIFSKIAYWVKAMAILGLLLQVFLLGFAFIHYRQHAEYLYQYPAEARKLLAMSIVELIQVIVFSFLNILFYRCGIFLQKAVSVEGTEQELERGITLNLRILKMQSIMSIAMMLYYAWLLIPLWYKFA